MLGRKEQNQTDWMRCPWHSEPLSYFGVIIRELIVNKGAGKPLNGRIHEWGDFCYRYEKEYSQRPSGKSRAVMVTSQAERRGADWRGLSLGNRGKGTGRCRTVSMCVCARACVCASRELERPGRLGWLGELESPVGLVYTIYLAGEWLLVVDRGTLRVSFCLSMGNTTV